jgi:flagellar protein FlgJ
MISTAAQAAAAHKSAAPLPPQQMAALKKNAQEFEAMFLSEMMGHMFEGVEVDDTFGGGRGEEIFRSLMINEYSQNIAKSPQGIGLANHVQQAMLEMQAKMNAK